MSFEASTDAKQIVENEYVQVTFTLNNAQGASLKAPDFRGFNIISGPNRSTSMTIINGARSQKMGFTYTLQPKKIGKYRIGSASIIANGKTIKTAPITIEVLKAKTVAKGASAEQQLFVKAEIDTTVIYLGQQLMVNYKLYTTANVESYDIMQETDYAGFFAHDVRRFNSSVVREVVDGVQYTTKVLKRVALFPQQTGLLKVEPMTLRLGMVIGKARRNSFFFNNQVRQVTVKTNPLEINVKNLPQPLPDNFSGAVGNYSIAFNLNRNKVTTDDALSITLAIRGDGDIKRLQPPTLELPAAFEVYEPKIIDESSNEQRGILSGYKKIEYLMIPKQPGNYQIAPSFTYFDTDSTKYVTLQPNVFSVAVTQGKGVVADNALTAPIEQPKDIRYIKTKTTFSSNGTPFPKTGWFYGLSLMPFLLLGGAVFYKRKLTKNGTIDFALLKSQRAQSVAKKRLTIAEGHLKAQKSRAFYDEISKALLGYVGDKLQIPLSELSKDNVREKLQSLKVTPAYIENVTSIIKTTEMALFAGMDNAASMQEVYDKSMKVLSTIEEELAD